MQYGIEIFPSHTITSTESNGDPSTILHGTLDGADFHSEVVNGPAAENERDKESSDVRDVHAAAVRLRRRERAERHAESYGKEYQTEDREQDAAHPGHAGTHRRYFPAVRAPDWCVFQKLI